MTTDRTQPARTAAPTDRAGAQHAERRNGDAFAALLDAHAATRGDERTPARTDDRAARHDDRHADRRDGGSGRDHLAARREPVDVSARRDAAGRADHAPRPETAARAESVIVGDLATAPTTDGTAAAGADLAAVGVTVATPEPVAADLLAIARDLAAGRLTVPAAPVTNLQTAPEAPVLPQTPVAAQPAATAPVVPPPPVAPQATGPAAPTTEAAPQTPATPAVPVDGDVPAPAADQPRAETPATPQARVEHPAAPATTAAPAPAEEPSGAPQQPAATTPAAPKAEPAAPDQPAQPAQPVADAPHAQTSAPLAGQAGPHRAEPLHRAPAAVATLLHVAAERGITRAKMALRPAELGGIEIRLQSTAAGVASQVVADSPEAARLLAHATEDLRRALEARDVTLLSLEVSTTADQQQQSARGERSDGDGTDAGLYGSSDRGTADPDSEPAPTTHSVIELPGGLLVDVLA